MTVKTSLVTFIMAILLVGCANGFLPSAHRHAMQQGNLIEREEVDKLNVGMNEEQVRYLLGNPVIGNMADDNQWLYSFSAGKLVEPGNPQLLMVSFYNGVVTAIDDNYQPDQSLEEYRANVASDFD